MDKLKALWATVQRTDLWRAWTRYGDARGNLLAGGVTYFAFFSIFPAVALAFTAFGLVLQGQPDLLDEVKNYLNGLLPGFLKESPDSSEGLIPLEMPTSGTLSVAGAIGVVGLLWAGLGWLGALRDGIRTIFGLEGEPGNFVTNKLRDLGVLLLLGVAIVVSAGVTGVAGAAASWLAELIGLGGQWWILKLVSVVVGVILDGAIVLVLLRLLSGADVPWAGLRSAALIGGIGLTILKLLGTTLLGAMNNPLYASIALVVGLLVWLNYMSRVVLLSAAWAANHLDETRTVALSEGVQAKLAEGPLPERETRLEERRAARHADTSAVAGGLSGREQRAVDRASVVSGAVVGAAATAGLGALAGLWRGARRVGHRRSRRR
jgi:membrane protein